MTLFTSYLTTLISTSCDTVVFQPNLSPFWDTVGLALGPLKIKLKLSISWDTWDFLSYSCTWFLGHLLRYFLLGIHGTFYSPNNVQNCLPLSICTVDFLHTATIWLLGHSPNNVQNCLPLGILWTFYILQLSGSWDTLLTMYIPIACLPKSLNRMDFRSRLKRSRSRYVQYVILS